VFLTVTPNSAIDQVIFIERFVPTEVMRTNRYRRSIGGKGMDIALVLKTFDADLLAISIVAGRAGEEVGRMLEAAHIPHELVWAEGETRTAHVIVETAHNRHSHITTGDIIVQEAHLTELHRRCQAHLRPGDWMLCAGSLPGTAPANYYASLIALAREQGCSSLLDTSGPPMRAALAARPTIFKLNQQEFAQTFALPQVTMDALIEQAQQVWSQYQLDALVLTCGSEGLFAVTPVGTFHSAAPPQTAVNAAGAGDAASAALTFRLSQGDSWPEALVWAAAAGAATVLTDGTAECHMADVLRIKPEVLLTQR
jgi:1-phosphofructokinase family hexose kinase